jgi:hypothetical protein
MYGKASPEMRTGHTRSEVDGKAYFLDMSGGIVYSTQQSEPQAAAIRDTRTILGTEEAPFATG